jgi:hypothetical protein
MCWLGRRPRAYTFVFFAERLVAGWEEGRWMLDVGVKARRSWVVACIKLGRRLECQMIIHAGGRSEVTKARSREGPWSVTEVHIFSLHSSFCGRCDWEYRQDGHFVSQGGQSQVWSICGAMEGI